VSFRRAGLFGSCAVIAIAVALAPASALAENPNNHGHHYGQLKHRQPPPTPNASPASGLTNSVHLGTSSSAPTQATNPAPKQGSTIPRKLHLAASNPGDGVSWLVLLILPLLAAVWALTFARGALALARRRRTAVATV
jgi:hypothetical protein